MPPSAWVQKHARDPRLSSSPTSEHQLLQPSFARPRTHMCRSERLWHPALASAPRQVAPAMARLAHAKQSFAASKPEWYRLLEHQERSPPPPLHPPPPPLPPPPPSVHDAACRSEPVKCDVPTWLRGMAHACRACLSAFTSLHAHPSPHTTRLSLHESLAPEPSPRFETLSLLPSYPSPSLSHPPSQSLNQLSPQLTPPPQSLPPQVVTGIKIWNLNASSEQTYCGVRQSLVYLDGVQVTASRPAEGTNGSILVRKAPGNSLFDFGQFIPLGPFGAFGAAAVAAPAYGQAPTSPTLMSTPSGTDLHHVGGRGGLKLKLNTNHEQLRIGLRAEEGGADAERRGGGGGGGGHAHDHELVNRSADGSPALSMGPGLRDLDLTPQHLSPQAGPLAAPSSPMVSGLAATACHCLPLPAIACHCLPLPTTACHCLPLPTTACHSLPLPTTACHCLPLPATTYHCLPLPATACHCLPLPATACHCLSRA